ncbi:MAG: hypothetical protein F4227_02840 [Gammaproteobacteria bacterium]|nr:hypothetical protein [Gammaproteobacteria bacterium]
MVDVKSKQWARHSCSTKEAIQGYPTLKPPKPQEPRPAPEEEHEPSNPADDVTDTEIADLKSCWEGKAGNKLNKNGWTTDATTAATWKSKDLSQEALANPYM